nr:hypothetical protein [candidate division Zixibacteria bacterium]
MANLENGIKRAGVYFYVLAGLSSFASGCGVVKQPMVGVKDQQARTLEKAIRDARVFVNDSNYVVIDSLFDPSFGNYIVQFKFRDSTRTIYVPKDSSKKPHDLFFVEGVN